MRKEPFVRFFHTFKFIAFINLSPLAISLYTGIMHLQLAIPLLKNCCLQEKEWYFRAFS